MEITTYSNFRQHLKSFMEKVLESHAPLFVTRSNGADVVVMSKEGYESIQETLYLLSSFKNAERLARGIREYEAGKGTPQDLTK